MGSALPKDEQVPMVTNQGEQTLRECYQLAQKLRTEKEIQEGQLRNQLWRKRTLEGHQQENQLRIQIWRKQYANISWSRESIVSLIVERISEGKQFARITPVFKDDLTKEDGVDPELRVFFHVIEHGYKDDLTGEVQESILEKLRRDFPEPEFRVTLYSKGIQIAWVSLLFPEMCPH